MLEWIGLSRTAAVWIAIVSTGMLIAALVVTVLGSGCASSQPVEGEPLVVFANWRGEDADAFRSTLERFEQDTGIEGQHNRVRADEAVDLKLVPAIFQVEYFIGKPFH